MKKIIIFGITEMSRVISEYIEMSGTDKVVAYTADVNYIGNATTFNQLPLISFDNIELIYSPEEYHFLTVLSTQSSTKKISKQKFEAIKEKGYPFYSFISPQAFVSPSAQIGENCIVCPTAVVEPYVIIEDGAFIRSSAYISHGTRIGAYSYIAPRATFSGNVILGKHCFVGTNSTIRDNITIGEESIVGAGAVVLKDLPDKSVYKAAAGRILPIDRYKIKP